MGSLAARIQSAASTKRETSVTRHTAFFGGRIMPLRLPQRGRGGYRAPCTTDCPVCGGLASKLFLRGLAQSSHRVAQRNPFYDRLLKPGVNKRITPLG